MDCAKCRRGSCFLGLNKTGLSVLLLSFSVLMFLTSLILTSKNYNNSRQEDWAWVGGVQSNRAVFRVRVPRQEGVRRTFVVSTSPDLAKESARVKSESLRFNKSDENDYGVKSVSVSNLESDTTYYYGSLDEKDVVVWNIGSFKTPVPEGTRMNFKVATGGCALTGSKSSFFDTVAKDHEPFLFIHAGDLHYGDISSTNMDERIEAFDKVMGSPSQGRLFSSVAMSYIWDDHDWVGNNQDGSDKSAGEAARKSYQIVFPHYTLAALTSADGKVTTEPENAAPYQAFTIGTVRFIVLDLRSESQNSNANFEGSIYSEEQKEWLFGELESSQQYDFVVLVTSRPWTGPAKRGSDGWKGFDADRKELSEVIGSTVGKGRQNLLVISSDNHQVAFDDGSSTDYSAQTDDPAGFPLIHSGPMANFGSRPRTEYFTDGCHAIWSEVNHHFTIIEFQFPEGNETEPCIEIQSYSNGDSLILTKKLCGQIMKVGTDEEITCKTKRFSMRTSAFMAVVFALIFFFIVATYVKMPDCKEATYLSAINIVFFVITMLAAAAGALSFGTIGVDMLALSIVALLQTLAACIFLFCMVKDLKVREKETSGDNESIEAKDLKEHEEEMSDDNKSIEATK